ncbi:hypothetical protein CEV31_3321 [Brucella thiophenivorans]|uniref:Uncharacterized protein n=1 Tax=Brucella thiophenivorans TaxID=571255 RepID=A0A256FIZ1_9HYPH|nr:hypothetical protein CEV31_3321 [Brucella thiophenivorans]
MSILSSFIANHLCCILKSDYYLFRLKLQSCDVRFSIFSDHAKQAWFTRNYRLSKRQQTI